MKKNLAGFVALSLALSVSAGCRYGDPAENHAPELAVTPAARTVTQGYPMEAILVAGSDEDGDALTLEAEGLPQGATLTPVAGQENAWEIRYSASATAQVGEFLVTLSLDDGQVESPVEGQATITVTANGAPVFDMVAKKSVGEDSELFFTVHATDPEGEVVSYDMETTLSGTSFDEPTATFTIPARSNAPGDYTVTFSATDTNGHAAQVVVPVAILRVNTPPEIVETSPVPSEVSVTEKSEDDFSLTVNAVDDRPDPLTFAWTAQVGATTAPVGTGSGVSLSHVLGVLHPADGATVIVMVEVSDTEGGTDDHSWTLHYTQAAVYVDLAASGSSAGTPWAPVNTLALGMTLAGALGKSEIRISEGDANPWHGPLTVPNGISLKGGFEVAGGLWLRDPAANTTLLNVPSSGLLVSGITQPVEVSGFLIASADATGTGASSYGVRVINNSAIVTLKDNVIFAGNGSNGFNGASGTSGSSGGTGASAGGFIHTGRSGGSSSCGVQGGNGGNGDTNFGGAGATGSPGASGGAAGGSGGASSDSSSSAWPGGNGLNGVPVTNGLNGAAGGPNGTVSSGLWVPSNGLSGANGSHGRAGGGGGGGGAGSEFVPFSFEAVYGGGGGGGGAGGCGGNAATGAQGGGGSFGILVVNSQALVTDCEIHGGNGGKGGNGGTGGNGGLGGNGGNGSPGLSGNIASSGAGGKGGNGNAGGRGGHGGNGSGGPSIGIKREGSSVTVESTTFTGGVGGAPGTNPDGPGTAQYGLQVNIW